MIRFSNNLAKHWPILNDVKMSSNVCSHYGFNRRFNMVQDKNVWVEFNALTNKHKAVNLGQGFPNYDSIKYLKNKSLEVAQELNNTFDQYTRSSGHLRLVNSVAKCYSSLMKREINPLSEVLISVGASNSLYNSFTSLLSEGDEVIIIEPFFDCYAPMSITAGAKCVFVPLKPKTDREMTTSADWSWDTKELEAAFSPKTKLIVINTPNNPLGKVYTREELQQIADLCIKHNTL
ncbi:kynurenine--oxoglutarate transaminase 1-like, partial [Brachionus plicatilis]